MYIDEEIIKNRQLNVYEKMILIVLVMESDEILTANDFVSYLSCSQAVVKENLETLVQKGYLKEMPLLKKEKNSSIKDWELDTFEAYENKIDLLHEMIEEPINDRQARIILNLAKNNLELIEEKYKEAVYSQFSDKIGLLVKKLQHKQEERKKSSQKTQINHQSISKLKRYKMNKGYKKEKK